MTVLFVVLFFSILLFNADAREPAQIYVNNAKKKELVNFSFEDCQKYLKSRAFKSREELFQLFYDLFFSKNVKNIEVNENTIKRLDSGIKTLFPLDNCRRIIFYDDILILFFQKDQDVFVPGTFFQVSMEMPKVFVFRLKQNAKNEKELVFEIMSGYVKLRFSLLFKFLGAGLGDIDGDEIRYTVIPIKKYSTIGLSRVGRIKNKEEIELSGDEHAITLNINTSEFPHVADMVFKKDEIKIFEATIKLLPPDTVQLPDGKKIRNAEQFKKVEKMISTAFSPDARDIFTRDLVWRKTMDYDLETRDGRMSMRFSLSGSGND